MKKDTSTLISSEDKYLIQATFNNTKAEYPKEKTIHQLFEEQVEKTPNNVALVYQSQKLTYKELNEKANQLARTLLRKPDRIVNHVIAIMMEKSLEMIVGIIAILKAGGAYLPINPLYPQDRIQYMLEDSGAEILLTQTQLIDKAKCMKDIILMDVESLYKGDCSNQNNTSNSEDMAYIIYTSGSTGNQAVLSIL